MPTLDGMSQRRSSRYVCPDYVRIVGHPIEENEKTCQNPELHDVAVQILATSNRVYKMPHLDPRLCERRSLRWGAPRMPTRTLASRGHYEIPVLELPGSFWARLCSQYLRPPAMGYPILESSCVLLHLT